MGQGMYNHLLEHEYALKEKFFEVKGMSIREYVNKDPASILWVDESLSAPFFKYKDRQDYYT